MDKTPHLKALATAIEAHAHSGSSHRVACFSNAELIDMPGITQDQKLLILSETLTVGLRYNIWPWTDLRKITLPAHLTRNGWVVVDRSPDGPPQLVRGKLPADTQAVSDKHLIYAEDVQTAERYDQLSAIL